MGKKGQSWKNNFLGNYPIFNNSNKDLSKFYFFCHGSLAEQDTFFGWLYHHFVDFLSSSYKKYSHGAKTAFEMWKQNGFGGSVSGTTPRKFNIAPKNRQSQRKLIFLPSFLRAYVRFWGFTSFFCWKLLLKRRLEENRNFRSSWHMIEVSWVFTDSPPKPKPTETPREQQKVGGWIFSHESLKLGFLKKSADDFERKNICRYLYLSLGMWRDSVAFLWFVISSLTWSWQPLKGMLKIGRFFFQPASFR